MASPYMNHVALIGNLVKKPELQETPKGTAYATLRLALTRRSKDDEGNVKDNTTFLDISTWGKTAKFFANYADKGCAVAVTARLATSEWEKDGKKYSKLTVVCEEGQLLTWPKDKSSKNNDNDNTARSTDRPSPQPRDARREEEEDDDIPF